MNITITLQDAQQVITQQASQVANLQLSNIVLTRTVESLNEELINLKKKYEPVEEEK